MALLDQRGDLLDQHVPSQTIWRPSRIGIMLSRTGVGPSPEKHRVLSDRYRGLSSADPHCGLGLLRVLSVWREALSDQRGPFRASVEPLGGSAKGPVSLAWGPPDEQKGPFDRS